MVDAKELARIARTHWWSGTDEVRLARAARVHDCDMPLVRRGDPIVARQTLLGYLDRRIPVLLCVDEWSHWVTVVHHDAGRFVVIDSRRDPVLVVQDWPKVKAR